MFISIQHTHFDVHELKYNLNLGFELGFLLHNVILVNCLILGEQNFEARTKTYQQIHLCNDVLHMYLKSSMS